MTKTEAIELEKAWGKLGEVRVILNRLAAAEAVRRECRRKPKLKKGK